MTSNSHAKFIIARVLLKRMNSYCSRPQKIATSSTFLLHWPSKFMAIFFIETTLNVEKRRRKTLTMLGHNYIFMQKPKCNKNYELKFSVISNNVTLFV